MTEPMATKELAALYNTTLSNPLRAVIAQTNAMLLLLAHLPKADKAAINAATHAYVETRTNEKAFVHPDTLSTLPSLFRNVQALDGFFQAAAIEARLTPLQIAAASLRWEPLDQFHESINAIADAVGNSETLSKSHATLLTLLNKIKTGCEDVKSGISDSVLDTTFLQAVAELTGKNPSIYAQPLKNAPQDIREIYESHLAGPLTVIGQRTRELIGFFGTLPEKDQERIDRLYQGEHGRQCTVLGDHPPIKNIVSALRSASLGVDYLSHGFKNLATDPNAVISEWQEQTLSDSFYTSNQLRRCARALTAILHAINTPIGGNSFEPEDTVPGVYDELLKRSSAIAANCLSVQRVVANDALDNLIKDALAARATPPTALENAKAVQISRVADRGIA